MHIARLGPFARRFLEKHREARVSAIFARSFHLEAGEDAIAVVDPALGDGAINAVLLKSSATNEAPVVGATALADGGSLHVDGISSIVFTEARNWRPPGAVWTSSWKHAREALLQAALEFAPRDGAFRAALDESFAPSSPPERALRDRAKAFSYWLVSRDAGEAPVAGLIGLGSGLTPAGDDFVGGAMIALHAQGKIARVESILESIERLGSGATTIFSRSMLRAAGEGFGGAALHEVIAAVAAGDAYRAVALLDRIDRIGHTSGWDALAGALVTLRIEAWSP